MVTDRRRKGRVIPNFYFFLKKIDDLFMSFDRPCHGATGAAPPSSLPSNQCPSRMEKGSRRELHSSSTDSRSRSRSARSRSRSRTRRGPRIDRSKSNSHSSRTGVGPTDRSRSRRSRESLPPDRSERRFERRHWGGGDQKTMPPPIYPSSSASECTVRTRAEGGRNNDDGETATRRTAAATEGTAPARGSTTLAKDVEEVEGGDLDWEGRKILRRLFDANYVSIELFCLVCFCVCVCVRTGKKDNRYLQNKKNPCIENMSLFSCSFIFVLAQEAAFSPHLSPVGPAAEEPARGRFQKKVEATTAAPGPTEGRPAAAEPPPRRSVLSKDSFDAVLVCQRVDQRLKKEIYEAHLEPVEQGGASAAAVVVLGEHLVGINVGLTNVLLVYRDVKKATIQADRHSPSSPEEEKRIVAGGAKVEGGKAVALGKNVPASRCFGLYRLKQETVINVLTTTP